MKKQFIELEFDKNTSIDDILEELIYYKKLGITAKCKVNGKILSNDNEKELQKEIENIEKSRINNDIHETNENKELELKCKLICKKYQYPKIVRYWIEKTKSVITLEKHLEWDIFCYETMTNYFENLKQECDNEQEIEKLKTYFYKTIIYISLILIKLNETNNQLELQKEIDKIFMDVEFSIYLDIRYKLLLEAVSNFSNKSELYKTLVLDDKLDIQKEYKKLVKKSNN